MALALGVLAGCGGQAPARRADGRIDVVTTTTQLTDFARVVGGDHVVVHGILRSGVDPHDYEPSPADLDQIASAQVIVQNGVGLEGWFASTIRAAEPTGEVVDASRGVAIRHPAGTGGEGDPHIWQDPRNASIMAADIERALVRADPRHRVDYEANLRGYQARLADLDRWIAGRIDTLSNRRLVTNHDAFGYYVARYGLQFEGSIVPSFDTSAQLSASDVQALVRRIRTTGVKAVFSETSLPAKTADAIGREAGVRVVAGPGSLYGDTLGPPGSPGATYVGAMRHNTEVIVDNLR